MKLVTVPYIMSLLLIIIHELVRKKNRKIDTLFLVNVWFSIAYLIIPIITINDTFFLNDHYHKYVYLNQWDYLISFIYISIFYLAFLLSYSYRKKRKPKIKVEIFRNIKLKKLIIILLLLGLFGLVLYIVGYGGLSNVLGNVNRIRSGNLERNTFAAIARLFTNYLLIVLLLSFYESFLSGRKDFTYMRWMFFISGVMVFLSSMLTGGRSRLVTPTILIYFIYVNVKNKIHYLKLLIVMFLGVVVVLYGNFILGNLENGFDYIITNLYSQLILIKYNIKYFVQNFTHPYYSLLAAMNSVGTELSPIYFLNPIYTIMFLGNIFNLYYQGTISHYNTLNILGIYDSNIPPGLIALGYYNLPLVGIPVGGLLYGYILGYIEGIFNNSNQNGFNIILYIYTINIASRFLLNGDLRVILIENIPILILIMVMFIFKGRLFNKD